MKPILFATGILFCYVTATAQQQNICTQQFSNINIPAGKVPVEAAAAKDIVQDILNVTGITSGFTIKPAAIRNAAAVIYNGKRYVLYNADFIDKLNQATGNDWASVSVLAHEIGHHLNGHTINNEGSQHSRELEADEFSGYIMQRLGATLEEAEIAMKLAADAQGTSTHPGKDTRLAAIEKGWNRASEQLTADIEENEKPIDAKEETTSNSLPASTAITVKNKTAINEKYIAADVIFDNDNSAEYYITIRSNVVAVKDGQLYTIGQVKENNSHDYPFIIETGNSILYIGKGGIIYDKTGNRIGAVKEHVL